MARCKRFWPLAFALFFLTNLTCIRDDYVEKLNNISFMETLRIESEMEARLAAHFIPARVRGDAPSHGGSGDLEVVFLCADIPTDLLRKGQIG